MRKIFISHPFCDAPTRNSYRVARLARHLALRGTLPFAPHIYLPRFIDEATVRGLALRLSLALVALSDEVRLYGALSEGVRLEIAEAHRLGIPVVPGDDAARLALTGEPPPMRTRGR